VNQQLFSKAVKLLNELTEHSKTGTGHPEPLKGKPAGRWSRAITKKHRLVYCIYETEVHVDVLTAYGHYDDK
jgi:toxin YoeB